MMKVAISAYGKNLKAQAYERFGRCRYFVIVDTETDETSALKNKAADALSGAGIECAQKLSSAEVTAVVTGKVGSNAYEVLKAAGVNIYLAPLGISVQQALDEFKIGHLPEAVTDIEKGSRYENCYFSVR